MIEVPTTPVERVPVEGWERLYEVSLAMLCVVGFDGYFRTVNPAWVTTLGHSMQDLLAVPVADFVHPDDKAATRIESVAANAGNSTAHFRNRYRHRDGSYRWLAWLVVADASRQLIFASARDITVEKEAEAARVKAQAVLDAVYRSITDHAIYMVDPAGVVLSWSLGAESVKGWKAGHVIGKNFEMFYGVEEIATERPRRDLEAALAQARPRTGGVPKPRPGAAISRRSGLRSGRTLGQVARWIVYVLARRTKPCGWAVSHAAYAGSCRLNCPSSCSLMALGLLRFGPCLHIW